VPFTREQSLRKSLWATVGATIQATIQVSAAWGGDVSANTGQPAGAFERRWSATFSDEVRVYSWRNNFAAPAGGAGKGFELYIPYALQLTGKPSDDISVDIVGRGGWVKASQSTPGPTGEVATTTDTVASATITYLGWKGLQPFVAILSNLPTGRSELFGNAANARMDPDLVEISSFGEGFNIGPTLGFNIPVSPSLVLTTSAGYTSRGSFQREASLTATPPITQAPSAIKPGDNLTATASVTGNFGALSSSVIGSYSTETATSQDGLQVLRPGDRYLVAATLAYDWSKTSEAIKFWGATTLTASAAHANRNNVLVPGATELTKETLDSNSNVFRVGLQHLFPIDKFSVGPTGSVLFRDRNGYDSATLQFVPQKVRWSAGLLAGYSPSDTVTFNARIEGVWTRENQNPATDDSKFSVIANGLVPASAVPVVSGTALQTSLGVNVKL
jgi:hypothetical protein